jgi:alcohol dehydrogenase class IV
MNSFVYHALPSRVIFGVGTRAQITEEARALGIKRALVLTTPRQTEYINEVISSLGMLYAGTFSNAAMHTPVDVTEGALEMIQQLKIDGLIAVGGGSTTGLSKAIALRTDVPQVILPTTYSGSEMTGILGQTENGLKTTIKSLKVLPETVIYDVELSLGLPVKITGTSGMNAIAHAIEALYAPDANPITSLMAEAGIRALASSLPKIGQQPTNLEFRSEALYGAWLCANCLAQVSMGLHHKLCHTLGGTFGLPHAETHSIILPHATAYNAPFASETLAPAVRALGSSHVPKALFDLAKNLGAKLALHDLGMPEEGIEQALELAIKSPYPNPRPLERAAIKALLTRAWHGAEPIID